MTSYSFFLNLPVVDVAQSRAFFEKLGFDFDPAFTDETATCMVVNDRMSVMLLARPKWAEHSARPLAEPTTHAIGLHCFGVSSREEVDTIVDTAISAGGVEANEADDHGFMYGRAFFDLDGHGWQVMWMDPAAMTQE